MFVTCVICIENWGYFRKEKSSPKELKDVVFFIYTSGKTGT